MNYTYVADSSVIMMIIMQNIYSVSTSKQHHQWSISPPHLPQDSDIECHYFGCYYIDMYEYDDVDYDDIIDIVILPNATCTFSQLGEPYTCTYYNNTLPL